MEEKTTIETLKKPDYLNTAKQKLDDFLNYNYVRKAWDFADDLEEALSKDPNFASTSPDLYSEYQDIITKMKLIALPMLKDEEIVAVLKDHFSIMLLSFPPVTNDIVDKLTTHMLGMIMYEERDELKGKIMKILSESQEILTTNNIKDEKGGEQSPTISNWIKNYLSAMEGPEDDFLKSKMYLYNARSRMNLSDKESDALKSLISLYEFLRKSSQTLEGLDESILFEENGILKNLDHGNVEIIGPMTG